MTQQEPPLLPVEVCSPATSSELVVIEDRIPLDTSELRPGTFLLVELPYSTGSRCYVACITSNNGGVLGVSYLRKNGSAFIYPIQPDEDTIQPHQAVMVLPDPTNTPAMGRKRGDLYSFDISLPFNTF